VIDFVLHPPRRDEQDAIDDCLNRCLNILPDALGGRMEAAMLKLHTKA
jgi:PTH1 family peptidyl-tRNA hydrolase